LPSERFSPTPYTATARASASSRDTWEINLGYVARGPGPGARGPGPRVAVRKYISGGVRFG
jgi:hypothetical protein